ncbi:matrilysin-like isoform X1 [Mustelus asterias]
MKAMYFCVAVVLELGFLAFSSTALPLSLVKDANETEGAQKAYRFQLAANLVSGTVNPNLPRCGVTDAEEFTTLGAVFEKKDLTYRIQEYTPDLPRDVVDTTIKEAFQYWADVTPLTFTQIPSPADIEIRFVFRDHGDGSPFDGPGRVLAHAFRPGPGIGGDAHFDEDEQWTNTSEDFNLLIVAVHEFGHSLGLGHTNVSGSVMLPFYTFMPKDNFALSGDDVAGIQSLYGAAVDTTQAPSQTSTQALNQTSTQAPSQTSTQAPSQTSTQAPSQTSTQTPRQTSTQAPSQTTSSSSMHRLPLWSLMGPIVSLVILFPLINI